MRFGPEGAYAPTGLVSPMRFGPEGAYAPTGSLTLHARGGFFAGGPGPIHRALREVMIDARRAPAKVVVLAPRRGAGPGDSLLVQRDVGSIPPAF
jgi:hypothetical protein